MADDEARGNGESTTEGVKETASDAKEAVTGGNGGNVGSILSSLKRKEVWIPVAASAATAAAGLAARKGPDLGRKVREKGDETAEGATSKLGEKGKEAAQQALQGASESGGVGGVAAKVASKALGGGGGGGKGKTRRLQIQRWTDVAVPVERAYELWTNFEEYPKFMHRVLSVQEQDEDGKIVWNEKIWFSKRQWEAEIVEQSENEFISWKTVSGASHAGVVSFHEIDDNLTRVMVTMDFRPTGMFEKMASGLRFVKRAVQADLARFKSYAEFQEAGLEDPQSRQRAVEEEEDSDRDEDEERDRGGDEQPEARGDESRNEDEGGEEPSAEQDDEGADYDPAAEREERERRREERREQVTA